MIEANHVVPYTSRRSSPIIACACDQMARTSYERRRARAMTLLMRYAGLRISDVVTLSRDHIRGMRLGKARDQEPSNDSSGTAERRDRGTGSAASRKAPPAKIDDSFEDTANLRSLVKGAWRTMAAVFRQAG
jgi:hypothetical protein